MQTSRSYTSIMVDTATDSKYWIPTTKDEYPQIIRGGEDKASGETLYVGRLIHDYDLRLKPFKKKH